MRGAAGAGEGAGAHGLEGFALTVTTAAGLEGPCALTLLKLSPEIPHRERRLSDPIQVGAGAEVGLATVRTLDAMYRSAKSGRAETCL